MEIEKKFLLLSSLLVIFLFSSFAYFFYSIQPVFSQPPVCAWRGYTKLNYSGTVFDGNTSNYVTSYTTASQGTNGTIESSSYYRINIPGTAGDNITLQICGVNVSQGFQTWSCGGAGYNILNISINTTATGSACTYNCGCAGTYCIHGTCRAASTYCGDSYCDSGETCTSCAGDCGSCGTTSSSSSSGGGGGGVAITTATTSATTTTTTPAVVETQTVTKIENGTSATFTINKSDTLKIETINVEVKNTVSNVQVSVKESSLPAGANLAIAGDQGAVYKYLEVTKVNVQDADINKVIIKFKVEKSWLTANGIDVNTVKLKRLVGSTWTDLPTTMLTQDSTYYYFEATSPGLSVFAITGQKAVVTATTTTRTTTTSAVIPPLPIVPNEVLFIVIVAVIILAAVVFWFRKKKKVSS